MGIERRLDKLDVRVGIERRLDKLDVRIGGSLTDAQARSHLADGRVVGWYGEEGHVIDAELTAQPIPEALAARYGTEDFWGRWTRTECAAKAADVPIAIWLARHGLDAGIGESVEIVGVTVSVARTPCSRSTSDRRA